MFSGLRNREVKAVIDTMKNKKNPSIKYIIDAELEFFKNDARKSIPNLYWSTIGDMYDKIVKKLRELADKEEKDPSASNTVVTTPGRQIFLVTQVNGDDYVAELDINKDFVNLQSFNAAMTPFFSGIDFSKYATCFDYWRCSPPIRIALVNDSAVHALKEYSEQCEKEGRLEVALQFVSLPQL
ncbi:predicted protein [Naegleria gruberi]|uniref:Predicted protein n=1 Tax=Naegleria gruberi TaxID=5762 RepID=D2V4B0_NAEGR|nr:uncharacterized protein NAEGRDRAFT_63660 [Naegleria gruberi]EFC48353.1 predicted protein [Naegleria gruberi]|eukprot:XP_002681097.1 predicted protein [Naegleria gruberi strain NEG-M]